LGGVVAIAALSGACGAPAVTPASANQMKLRMLVQEPIATTTDKDCSEEQLRRTFASELKGSLLRAGYSIAAPGAPHDVTWSISVNVSDCLANVDHRALAGSVEVTAETPDGMLYTGSRGPDAAQGLQDNWAPYVVNEFTRTPAVANYALAHANGTPVAVASAAPAPRSSPPPSPSATSKLRSGPIRGNAYALVVGVEKYRDVPPPAGARADAEHFVELAKKTLGVPGDHVRVALDDRATKADVEREIEWITTEATSGSRIYFFYSGHGAPDAAQGTPYLLPYDGDPKYVTSSGIPLAHVFDSLGKSKAQEVIAFVDACFSGAGGRSVLPTGARPLVRVKEAPANATPRIALFTSSGGAEISGATRAGGEGLFTHMLVEAIGTGVADIDGDGNLSLAEIATWVKPRVAREAREDHREQNPTLTTGSALGDPSTVILAGGLSP
jgi:hypothetical protein